MRGKLHFILLLFCMGIFIMPKQLLIASSTRMECCEKQTSGEQKCHQDKTSDSSHSQKDKGCTGGCCTACGVCSLNIPALAAAMSLPTLFKKYYSNAAKTPYTAPFFSRSTKEIWQPPKIS